jgi:hypothetical protein
VNEARRALGAPAFEDAWRTGVSTSSADAVEYALHSGAP